MEKQRQWLQWERIAVLRKTLRDEKEKVKVSRGKQTFALVANMDKQWSWNKVYFPAILVVGIGMLTARCEPTLLMAFLPQRMEMLKLLILGLEPHLHLLILVQHCLHQSQTILTPSELLADLTF